MIRNLEFNKHIEALKFIEQGHLYLLQGEVDPLISITQVLKAEGINEYFGNGDAEWAMQVGTWVHQAVEWDEEGTLDEATTSDGVLRYLQSYRAWKKSSGFVPLIVEEPMYHSVLRYGGKPDLFGRISGFYYVVELKTGGFRPGDRVQVGGQAELIRNSVKGMGRELFRGLVLYLKDSGLPPRVESMLEMDVIEEGKTFQAALRINQWKRANK